jgi:hypothetical protein
MRDRHIPRLCHSCQAPMARQEATCWNCGTRWADEDSPETTLRVIAGGAVDTDRWIIDGGSLDPEAETAVHAIAARR